MLHMTVNTKSHDQSWKMKACIAPHTVVSLRYVRIRGSVSMAATHRLKQRRICSGLAWLLGSDKARLRMHHEEVSNDICIIREFPLHAASIGPCKTFSLTFSLLRFMNTEQTFATSSPMRSAFILSKGWILLLFGASSIMPARFASPEYVHRSARTSMCKHCL